MTRKLREADAKLSRFYDALEQGTVEQDDFFKRRVGAAKAERDEVIRLQAQAERRAAIPAAVMTPKKLAAFSRGMEDMLRTGDIQFRKAYLRFLIGSIELMGGERNPAFGFETALLAAASAGPPDQTGGVPTLVQEWRPIGDESVNPRKFTIILVA